jgi:hypothetical protein
MCRIERRPRPTWLATLASVKALVFQSHPTMASLGRGRPRHRFQARQRIFGQASLTKSSSARADSSSESDGGCGPPKSRLDFRARVADIAAALWPRAGLHAATAHAAHCMPRQNEPMFPLRRGARLFA